MNPAFLREAMILGPDGLERLQNCHVIVFGIGGVGSYCAEALVRAGIGRLTFVDNDNREENNLPQEFKYELKDFSKAHEDLDISYLSRALDASGGNQRIAAASLGLTYDQFRGLYRKYKNRLK